MTYDNPASTEVRDLPLSIGRLYTVQEIAKLLNVSTNWFYERTRRDAIPFHKFGKYIRFTESDLAALVKMFSRGTHVSTHDRIDRSIPGG